MGDHYLAQKAPAGVGKAYIAWILPAYGEEVNLGRCMRSFSIAVLRQIHADGFREFPVAVPVSVLNDLLNYFL